MNGCHNSQRKDSYAVMVRDYLPDGTYSMKCIKIVDTSSRECKYDFRQNDEHCAGCEKRLEG